MWIFGYGSLMFDPRELADHVAERQWARLPGYVRVFNKKSVKNWGTKERPGLTLNLRTEPSGTCRGIAFAVADDNVARIDILAALEKREACGPRSLPVRLDDGSEVTAHVYIYEGRNLAPTTITQDEQIGMILQASGTSGACVNYVRKTFEDLERVGLDDPAVTELWRALKARL